MFKKVAVIFLVGSACFAKADTKEHPWLFFSKQDIGALQEKVTSDTWIAEAYCVLRENADYYMTVPTDPYPHTGEHNGKGTVGRALEKKTGVLAFTGYLTGDERYLKKAVDMIVAAAGQSDPDEHDVWLTHLQVADGARGYAVAYDWLYPYMNDQQRKMIREEIYKFGKVLYECGTCWGLPDPGVSSCNHNAVHFGALGLCALVLGDQPEWQARATRRIRDYFHYAMDSTGYFTEGHSYANYGLLGSLPYSCALLRAGGPDLVSEQPLLERMTDQFCWKVMPWGKDILCLNDNSDSLGNSAMLIYPITRYQQPEALWSWLQAVGEPGSGTYGMGWDGYQGDGMAVPYAILWADAELKPQPPSENGSALSHRFSSGRVFMRDSWGDSLGALASFTSGVDYHRGHNHQDENAFTFCAKGEDFAIDPGYTPKNTRSHNTMLVNGVGQIGASRGRVVEYKDIGDAVYVKGQAPEAYEWPEPLLGHFQRQILFGRAKQPYLLIVDDLQCEDDHEAAYTWLLHTDRNNQVSVSKDRKKVEITGACRGSICDVMVLAGDAVLSETDVEKETLMRRGKEYNCSRFYKELRAESKAVRFHQITLLIARDSDEPPAEVSCTGEGDSRTVKIVFSDFTDILTVSDEQIGFSRNGSE